ncbi:hypothetical protein PRIC1_002503 [Phytophthora ramorum]
MEVEQEVCATAAAAEGSVASEADQKPAERLREVASERLRWISKRQERLERMEKLLKLLELQGASNSNDEPIEAQAANSEAEKKPTDDQKSRNKAEAVLARKKELKELQARAETAKEKQQQAATVLIRNLRQLTAVRHAAQLTTTQWSPASKRKREEGDAEEQPSKKTDFGSDGAREDSVPSPEMHSFSATLELDVGTAELARAACFRIATRYFLTTGTRIPGNVLEQAFKTYTGKALDEVVSASSLERALVCFNTHGTKHTIYHSSSEIRSKRVWWQPGRQFLRSPTFIASDAEQIQKLIDVEKQIVMDVCESLRMSGNQHSKSTVLNTMRRQKLFLASLLNDGNAAASSLTLSNILAACIGVGSSKSTTNLAKRIHYRSHGQMAGVFANMESWLREQAETIEPQNSISSRLAGVSSGPRKDECFFTTRYTKPFCVENDSIVNQLRGVGTLYTSTTQKIDPLKVFCQYELNGICNDKNCSNYHQKDYEPVVTNIDNPSGGAGGDTRVLYSKETTDQLLLLFADFRGRMTTKWPVIITTESPSALAGNCTKTVPHVDSGLSVVQDMQRIAEASNEDGDDFIRLDIPEELSEIGDSRYFDDVESRKGYGDSLQAKVERDPNDADAWLLLAIYHLELDVGLSDEAANLSDNARLQHQLIYLCKKLSVRQSSSTFRDLNIEEANLTRCLHTLSRALEVEANAYCEALWLLYLHLCGEAANKQMEIDMVEHAVQFLPSSHALWLRYISTYDFDSVSMAEGVYWRLMEHLARVNSTEDGEDAAQVTPSKDLSILLTAMCFHLCIKLWRAGATSRVLKLLSAFLKLGDTPSEFDWCGMVRSCLRSDEVIVFCLVFAHVLLLNELPALIEHWVAASSHESIPIKGMAYTAESLQRVSFHTKNNFAQVLASYELAFSINGERCSGVHDAGGVILSNWMLLLSIQGDKNARDESLKTFFDDKLDTIQQYPAAALTAAKIMELVSTGEHQAHRLMLTMMNQSSERNFPEALHHYLFACRQSTALVNALDKTFPDVMERLASLLEFDINAVEKSIQDIMRDTSNISKSRALKTLLDALLAAWMDHLDRLRRASKQRQSLDSHPRSLADIYVALAICQLMGILLEASVAIDGLQIILSSPSFEALSLQARQLAWMQRFVFQVDLLQQNDSDSLLWKENQATLIQLFRKYMGEMSVKSEMLRQVSKRIERDLDRNALEDAVLAGPEKATFYSSFTDALALASEFSLAFSDTAVHEWELLAARASLRKCLGGAKTQHSQVLQALVAVELRLRNMKSVSSLLQKEMQADPLLLETWRLVVGLEILFGGELAERSEKIAVEMEKRQLVFVCNTFGDDKAIDGVTSSLVKDSASATSLTLRGLGLECVPNSVLLKNELISLDLTGNELTELPIDLNRLKSLQKLDVSENALVDFPECLNNMPNLRELHLAHNNLSVVSVRQLPNLSTMDLRWNTVEHLAVSDLAALKSIKMLRTEGNRIPVEEQSKILDLLSSRKKINACDARLLTGCQSLREVTGEKNEEQSTHALLPVSPSPEGVEDSATASTEAGKPMGAEISSAIAAEGTTNSMSKTDDGDQVMNAEEVNINIPVTQDDDGDQIMDVEEVDPSSVMIKHNEGEMVDDHAINSTLAAKEHVIIAAAEEVDTISVSKVDSRDRIAEKEGDVDIDAAATVFMTVNDTVHQPKEVIDVSSSESLEEAERDAEEQAQAASNNTEMSANVGNVWMPLANDEPCTETITEAEDFAQAHSNVITEAAERQRVGPGAACAALNKLTAYMEQNQIDSRAEVRRRNPALWQEFVAANLHGTTGVPRCRLCFAPGGQRFNSTILCLDCLEQALQVLKKRIDDFEQ